MPDDNLLLYIGSGLIVGGLFLAIVMGVIFAVQPKHAGFRYGAFFLGANLALVPLWGAAAVCFFFQFLSDGLAYGLAIQTSLICLGVLIAYRFLAFRSKALFIIATIPCLFSMYLTLLGIWNLIYILAVYKPAVVAGRGRMGKGHRFSGGPSPIQVDPVGPGANTRDPGISRQHAQTATGLAHASGMLLHRQGGKTDRCYSSCSSRARSSSRTRTSSSRCESGTP